MSKTEFVHLFELLLEQTPFQPFEVALRNGERVVVESRRDLAYRDGAVAHHGENKRITLFTHADAVGISVLAQ